MGRIGFDAGTYNLVACKRTESGDFDYTREINAFLEIPLEDDYTYNIMSSVGVPLIRRDDVNMAYAVGESAVKFAYTMSKLELKRPMSDGCVNPREKDAFEILQIMIHSLIGDIEKDGERLNYCIPANAINASTDADYHQKILDAIFKSYQSSKGYKVDARPINEAMALVYAELKSKMFTGLGISCLCPGTKIYTNEGIVEIQYVKKGDKVISHNGKWSEINNVITKKFSGVMTKIQISGYSNNTEEYKFVDNHELYVKRNGKWDWVGCEEIEVGDIVGEPIIKQDRNLSVASINICERTTCSKKWSKKKIESSPDLQRFMGYFMGNGSVNLSEGCVQIDFASHENFYADDALEILNKIFGKNSTKTEKGEGAVIRLKCYSVGLTNWMNNHCYDENRNKKYPWTIDRLSNNECLNLLTGLIRSDGCVSDEQVVFGNTNTHLILLAKQLFSRLNVAASIGWREPRSRYFEKEDRVISGQKNEWTVSAAGKKVSLSLVEKINNLNCENSQTAEKIFIEDGFCCGRVQAIDHEQYDGEVYDLQVPGDHSFSGPFLTIHNCGAGMVNVAYSLFGAPVFTFAIVNSGDWIDKQAAAATGESISFINKQKTKIDLSQEPKNMIDRAIKAQYELMIQKTVTGIKKGFEANRDKKTNLDNPLDFVVAGGTSSPPGFDKLFEKYLREAKLPVEIGDVTRPNDPLYAVARGCLISAENAS